MQNHVRDKMATMKSNLIFKEKKLFFGAEVLLKSLVIMKLSGVRKYGPKLTISS